MEQEKIFSLPTRSHGFGYYGQIWVLDTSRTGLPSLFPPQIKIYQNTRRGLRLGTFGRWPGAVQTTQNDPISQPRVKGPHKWCKPTRLPVGAHSDLLWYTSSNQPMSCTSTRRNDPSVSSPCLSIRTDHDLPPVDWIQK